MTFYIILGKLGFLIEAYLTSPNNHDWVAQTLIKFKFQQKNYSHIQILKMHGEMYMKLIYT